MIRRFVDYFPEPLDGDWATVQIREALTVAALADPLAVIDEVPFEPSGEYTTENAAIAGDAWYQLVFILAGTGDLQPTEPEQTPPAWAPSVQDVADVSQGYTRVPISAGGEPRGTFDETTDPTARKVRAYIAAAVDEVRSRVGLPVIPPRAWELAKTAAKWHAAATVEAEHGAASVDEQSSFAWKRSSYVASLNELVVQARAKGLRLT